MSRDATYLVTGGAGFIGSHIVERLLVDGCRVRVLDDLSTGRASNLGFTEGLPEGRFELIESDLADPAALARAMSEVTTVFHQAALPSVARSVEDPLESHRINTTGTLALLLAARDAGVSRVIYASSSSVYGETDGNSQVETMAPRPLSPYATGKLTAEHYCRVFHHVHGMGTIALRYFNVFGPRQDPASAYAAVIPSFLGALLRQEPPVVYGDGRQSRDFTFVSDIVEANVCAMRAAPDALGRVFNVAAGRRTSLLELIEMLGRILEVEVEPQFDPPRPGDVRHSQADSGLAERLLGWTARVGMEDGLRRTVEAFAVREGHAG